MSGDNVRYLPGREVKEGGPPIKIETYESGVEIRGAYLDLNGEIDPDVFRKIEGGDLLDAHGGADCYGNADGTGGSAAEPHPLGLMHGLIAAIALGAGAYLLGIGIAYLAEAARLWLRG